MVRVLLVDDHQLFRDALRALFQKHREIELVDDAASAAEAYARVAASRPHVVVMDVRLPGTNGIVATRELLRRDPMTKVLLLTSSAEAELVSEGLQAGALGFALKQQPGPQVLDAILEVARGRSYVASPVAHVKISPRPGGPCDLLSTREKEVFALLVRGLANDAIAEELAISIKTVETHRAHVLKKLRLHSLAELVRFAARNRLLSQDSVFT